MHSSEKRYLVSLNIPIVIVSLDYVGGGYTKESEKDFSFGIFTNTHL